MHLRRVTPGHRRSRSRGLLRRLAACSLSFGLLASFVGVSNATAATSMNKTLFVAVSNGYSAAVTEFNLVIDSFSACPSAVCVSTAIEGLADTRFYKATVALEKLGPYASGISTDMNEYVGNLIDVQKDINAVAKAKTIAKQKSVVSNTLELDIDNLAFRGMHILIYLGELKSF
jgi:hypothetical protein